MTVNNTWIRQNNRSAKVVCAFADKGLLLTLSNFKMALGNVGLEPGATEIEVFFNGWWIQICADSMMPVVKGDVVALRVKGVTEMENWDIDSQFFINK